MFVKLNNDEIEKYPYTLEMFREENSNKSLPKFLNDLFLATNNVFPVCEDVKPEYDGITQKLVKIEPPILKDEKWTTEWSIVAKSQDEIDYDYNQLATAARQQRDMLLSQCDWVTAKAFETSTPIPTEWAIYRQKLRDITTQASFPYNITWPVKI
jgi:hypothetical protein